jgi:hypothetical protein
LRRVVIPLVSAIILAGLAGCGGSAGTAPKVGGAKVDPDVEAQNQKAIETYAKEKSNAGR